MDPKPLAQASMRMVSANDGHGCAAASRGTGDGSRPTEIGRLGLPCMPPCGRCAMTWGVQPLPHPLQGQHTWLAVVLRCGAGLLRGSAFRVGWGAAGRCNARPSALLSAVCAYLHACACPFVCTRMSSCACTSTQFTSRAPPTLRAPDATQLWIVDSAAPHLPHAYGTRRTGGGVGGGGGGRSATSKPAIARCCAGCLFMQAHEPTTCVVASCSLARPWQGLKSYRIASYRIEREDTQRSSQRNTTSGQQVVGPANCSWLAHSSCWSEPAVRQAQARARHPGTTHSHALQQHSRYPHQPGPAVLQISTVEVAK